MDKLRNCPNCGGEVRQYTARGCRLDKVFSGGEIPEEIHNSYILCETEKKIYCFSDDPEYTRQGWQSGEIWESGRMGQAKGRA